MRYQCSNQQKMISLGRIALQEKRLEVHNCELDSAGRTKIWLWHPVTWVRSLKKKSSSSWFTGANVDWRKRYGQGFYTSYLLYKFSQDYKQISNRIAIIWFQIPHKINEQKDQKIKYIVPVRSKVFFEIFFTLVLLGKYKISLLAIKRTISTEKKNSMKKKRLYFWWAQYTVFLLEKTEI